MAEAVTSPPILEMLVGEQLNCSWDFAKVIAPGDTCSSPTVSIVNAVTNETVPSAVIGTPFVLNNTLIKATLNSTPLRKRTSYICTITTNVIGGGQTKVISAILTINIIF